jgi:hypothetical protein
LATGVNPGQATLSLRRYAHSPRRATLSESKIQYESTTRSANAVFSYKFENGTELIGSMRLKLWVSTSEGDDLDLFIVVRKLDASGNEVFFSGFNGYERDDVAKGWLRASHRDLDSDRKIASGRNCACRNRDLAFSHHL